MYVYIYYIVFVSCMWCGSIFKYSAIIETIYIYILSSIFVIDIYYRLFSPVTSSFFVLLMPPAGRVGLVGLIQYCRHVSLVIVLTV